MFMKFNRSVQAFKGVHLEKVHLVKISFIYFKIVHAIKNVCVLDVPAFSKNNVRKI